MKRIVASIAVSLALSSAAPSLSQAANPGYCHHYADLAVWQFHRAISHGCIGGPNLRWNANWDGHYSWCLSADYGAARHEDDLRGYRLHECM